jgi:hypothetical protein
MSEDEEDIMNHFFRERHRREQDQLNREIINFQRRTFLLNELIRNIPEFWELGIPPDFWEPVKVTANDSIKFDFEDTEIQWDCTICCEKRDKKTRLKCCNQYLCDSCIENWFKKESIKCPFCKKDIRDGVADT